MARLHFHCPRCLASFQELFGVHREEYNCPACTWNLAEENHWYLFRRKQRHGPYSWAQLRNLAEKEQFLPTDLLSSLEQLPEDLDSDLAMPKLVPLIPGQTTEDILGETAFSEDAGPLSLQGIKLRPSMTLSLGDFQILRKLGSGGMGAVYLAYQRSQDRKVALKMLTPALAGLTGYVYRFYREGLVLSHLNHPNIVPFYGAGEERGIPFFAMEYLEGFSTATLLQRLGHPLLVKDALHIVLKCLCALRYAHGQNIVHRDVKPENILITTLSKIKLADLGLAKPLVEDLSLTESGLTLGTPKFMAPEQARNAKRADHRSDIYALGGVLYFFLTDRIPFEGTTAMEMLLAKEAGHFTPARRLNPETPQRLDLILDKMLAKDAKHRYQSCGEVLHDLESLEMAGDYLSFNPLRVVPLAELQGPVHDPSLVEILLVDNDNADILLIQQALHEKGLPSNLNVVQNGLEARAFLRKEGKFTGSPHPNLIILGSKVQFSDIHETLWEMVGHPLLQRVPLAILSKDDQTTRFLDEHRLKGKLTVVQPDDMGQFRQFLHTIQGLCLTVVDAEKMRA